MKNFAKLMYIHTHTSKYSNKGQGQLFIKNYLQDLFDRNQINEKKNKGSD